MAKKTLHDIDPAGKRVLMRVDFNVPIQDGAVADDTRIRAAMDSIVYLLERGARLVMTSHLGRPKGSVKPEYSLAPVAAHLSDLLGMDVPLAPDCVGDEVDAMVEALAPGQALLLENVRFHAEEELLHKYDKQDDATKAAIDQFVQALAAHGDIFVNDAFGTAHRAHGSTVGVTKHIDTCVAGFLMAKEIKYFGDTLADPPRPFVAILGGAKVSDKVMVISSLLERVDSLVIGGAMAYTLMKARGDAVGTSLVEEDKLDVARDVLAKAEDKGISLLLPVDHKVAASFGAEEPDAIVSTIPDGMMGLDIGPKSVEAFGAVIRDAATVVWNGPMGVFEKPAFAEGTFAIAELLAKSSGISIVGGGDSVSAINRSGYASEIDHISTGGGASLQYLEGKTLPGIAALDDA